MFSKEFSALEIGDVVRHKSIGEAYVVTGTYGDRVTAVRTVDLTNSPEWELVAKANYNRTPETH